MPVQNNHELASLPSLEPPSPQSTTFDVAWSPSKSAAFDSSRVQLAGHVPRAWERSPHSPVAEDSRFKKVWKSYNLRQPSSQPPPSVMIEPPQSSSPPPAISSPQRPVKKLRTKSPKHGIENLPTSSSSPVKYVATRWERRRSSLPRKQVQMGEQNLLPDQHEDDLPGLDSANQAASDEILEPTDDSRPSDETLLEVAVTESHSEDSDKDITPETVEEDSTGPEQQHEQDFLIELDSTAQESTISISFNIADISEDFSDNIPQLSTTVSPEIEDSSKGHPTDIDPRVIFVENALLDETEKFPPIEAEDNSSLISEIHTETTRINTDGEPHETDSNDEKISNMQILSNSSTPTPLDGEEQVSMTSKTRTEDAAPAPLIVDLAVDASEINACEESSKALQVSSTAEASEEPGTKLGLLLTTELSSGSIELETSLVVSEDGFIPESPVLEAVQLDNPSTPPLEEATTTINLTSTKFLEEDKAFLESFLNRAAASKANRANLEGNEDSNCTRRESVQNRRDSDAVRLALASPGRVPLETRDANLFSPEKCLQSSAEESPSLQKSQENPPSEQELVLPAIDDLLANTPKPPSPRRSVRSRTSRTVLSTSTGPHQIAVRRGDGNDTATLSLTKTETQMLANETRRNTRKNKGSALSVLDRLVKWKAELAVLGKDGQTPDPTLPPTVKKKAVVWSEELEFLNEATGKPEKAPLLNNEQMTPAAETLEQEESVFADGTKDAAVEAEVGSKKGKPKSRKSSTPKVRRLRGLGAANGTPAKGVLASTLLPEEVAEQQATATAGAQPAPEFALPNSSKSRIAQSQKADVPTSEVNAAKSRIPPPKKLNLTPSVKSVTQALTSEGAENDTIKIAPKLKAASFKRTSMLPVAGQAGRRMVKKS